MSTGPTDRGGDRDALHARVMLYVPTYDISMLHVHVLQGQGLLCFIDSESGFHVLNCNYSSWDFKL